MSETGIPDLSHIPPDMLRNLDDHGRVGVGGGTLEATLMMELEQRERFSRSVSYDRAMNFPHALAFKSYAWHDSTVHEYWVRRGQTRLKRLQSLINVLDLASSEYFVQRDCVILFRSASDHTMVAMMLES